jgi:Flp pilus assembly protein TadG
MYSSGLASERAGRGRASTTTFVSRRSFREDTSGGVAMTFGLMAIVMVLFVGGAVDMGRWLHARSQTLAAMDAAVLAGARVIQLDSSDMAGAMESATRFYNQNVATRITVESDTISFAPTDDGLAFTASGNAYVRTPFLSLAGVERLPLIDQVGAEYAKAEIAAGGNAEQSIEISMMLDITGSMGGSKIADMKTAAKDLIDIVVWDDQSEYTSKVALAPFSAAVNPGSLVSSVAYNPASSLTFNLRDGSNKTWKKSSCVSERQGTNRYTDVAPTSSNRLPRVYSNDASCTPGSASAVTPLSSDKVALKAKIDAFSAGGSTAGHLGTAWAWYLLSPNWASVLPSGSKPVAYGTANTQKIAILMTDGEYNMQYCNNSGTTGASGPDKNANGSNSSKLSCTTANASSTTQARTLCTNMKAAGITVYTVGFEIPSGSTADTTLQQCATSPGHYYSAQSGEQLKQAFRDIALKISSLYLSR